MTTTRVQLIFPLDNGAAEIKTGLLHYVEHLTLFNTLGREAFQAGQDTNAWTSSSAVSYWLEGPPNTLSQMLQTLIGVFSPLTLTDDFARQERGVILHEYELRLGENLDGRVDETLARVLLKGNPAATSTIGDPEQIAALTYQEAKMLHDSTHRPERAVLVVSGQVDASALDKAIAALPLPQASTSRLILKPEPFEPAAPTTTVLDFPDTDAAPRLVWSRIITLDAAVPYERLVTRLALLNEILNTDLPGGLTKALHYDRFIASDFAIDLNMLDEKHVRLTLEGEPDVGISLEQLKSECLKALQTLASTGIPAATYQRVLGRFDYWPDWSDRADVADFVAEDLMDRLQTHRPPLSPAELHAIGQPSLEDINALVHQLGGDGRTAIARVGKPRTTP